MEQLWFCRKFSFNRLTILIISLVYCVQRRLDSAIKQLYIGTFSFMFFLSLYTNWSQIIDVYTLASQITPSVADDMMFCMFACMFIQLHQLQLTANSSFWLLFDLHYNYIKALGSLFLFTSSNEMSIKHKCFINEL